MPVVSFSYNGTAVQDERFQYEDKKGELQMDNPTIIRKTYIRKVKLPKLKTGDLYIS